MEINYQASPTAAKFHSSNKVVRCLKGPVGSGKSVTCIMEMLRLAADQWPNSSGKRKTRWALIRNTFPELRTTTLNTFRQWVPEQIAPVTMHPIIISKLVQPLKDGTAIEAEFIFLALDKPDDVKKLLSLEITGAFINEAREIPFAVVKAARERVGRYPSQVDGYKDDPEKGYVAPRGENGEIQACKRKAVLIDTNPPDTDSWFYQLAEEGCLRRSENKDIARRETARIFDFFHAPAPLIKQDNGEYIPNPKAENIKYLPGGYQYYLDMIAGNTEDHINVQVLGNYGMIKDGKAVYPEFNDRIHVAENHFVAIEGMDICLGWDGGLTPACTIGQLTETGQARIIAELVAEDMGIRQFARDVVKPYLQRNFPHHKIGFSLFDPSGNARGEGEGKSAIGILNDEYVTDGDEPLDMGFMTQPAPTNDPTKRLDAVRSFLIKMVGGGEPGFIMDKRCRDLRKGFNGGYCYKRIQSGGVEDRYRDVPDKNKFSHPHDSLQYLCLGFRGGYVSENTSFEDVYDMIYNDNGASAGYY